MTSILLAGVGGQGTILTAKILTEGLLEAGYDVKMSEIHGMAQRGGSVTTHIKFGECIRSPIICHGEADVLVAFEKNESLRYLDLLSTSGTLIINECEIYSQTVQTGAEKYPEGIITNLQEITRNTIAVDATQMASALGNVRTQNMILLGTLVRVLKIPQINWLQILEKYVPARLYEINRQAFQAGNEIAF